MAMTFGGLLTLGLIVVAVLGVTGAGVGTYALICNRMPGRWLARTVRNPRLWGTGILVAVSGLAFVSWIPVVIGLGIAVVGHTVNPTG
ncbi:MULTISPECIES: hypothetical protein [Streptomyces]|uniref:hypothetical protein n=1 Tax=Streptomyces TaxID=1883 RepID=UPI00131CE48F|nr:MULTISPECIES: hypothetical protein [Streptomyces]